METRSLNGVVRLVVVATVAFICTGCAKKVTDAMVKDLSPGTPIDRVVEILGQPAARGRKVTLKSEGSITREYPRRAEACLWKGERVYVLLFVQGVLAKKEAFSPDRTQVRVSTLEEGSIPDGDSIRVTLTKGVTYGGEEL